MIIIGITGKARSGKSTLGTFISKKYRFALLAFADALKTFASELSLNYDFFNEDLKDKPILRDGKTPREFLQKLGSDWVKPYFGDDIWVKHLENYIDLHAEGQGWPGIVISDVRFNEEAKWVLDKGGVILEVIRPNHENNVPDHSSEKGVDSKYVSVKILNVQKTPEAFLNHFDQMFKVYNEPLQSSK